MYSIEEFYGIDQSKNENSLHPGTASDARNMDTSDGGLSVSKGFVKHILDPIPGSGPVRRIDIFKNLVTTQYVAIAGDEEDEMAIYAYTDSDDEPEWEKIHTYDEVVGLRWDILQANIGDVDYMIFANGESQLVKWDGTTEPSVFGSSEKLSDIPVNFLCMHYDRLFAAGDPDNPSTLYYSKVPGSGATIEDWGIDEVNASKSGGSVIIGNTRGDPIIGLIALATQILIIKRYSVYRLQGSNPATWRIEKIQAEAEKMAHSSLTLHGDVAYYLTPVGLYYFNNITVQPLPDARMIQRFMSASYVEWSKGAECKDKLYFTCYVGDSPVDRDYDNCIIVYDIRRGTYMVRDGFEVADLISHDGVLYMVNGERYLYRFDEGTDYDGGKINSYWQTQRTDLHKKYQNKKINRIFLRGEKGGVLLFDTFAGQARPRERFRIADEIIEIEPRVDYARTFCFRLSNEAGGSFHLEGGLEAVIATDDGDRLK